MFRYFSASLRDLVNARARALQLDGSKSPKTREPRGAFAGRTHSPVEVLEGRRLLSVSAATLAGPFDVTGNRWTYQLTTAAGDTASFTQTVIGPTTFNGIAVTEIDQVYPGSVNKEYVGIDGAGDYVVYGNDFTGTGIFASTHDVYQPYQVIFPAVLDVNTPYPSSDVQVSTTLDSGVVTTTPESHTATLLSDSTFPVLNGAYDAYHLQDDVAATMGTGSDGSTSSTDASSGTAYYAAGVGLVTGTIDGTTEQLTNFSGKSFHLAATQPAKTLANEPIAGVQVSILDSTQALDTDVADAVTVTASIDPSSTGVGTLSGPATATTVGGVANFSGLSITKPGHYILDFKDSAGRSVPTTSFQITAGQLRFKRPLLNGVAGSALFPAVEVELVDGRGRIITDADNIVTLNIDGANSANPITGNQITLVHGIALFTSVKLGKPDEYKLDANDDLGDVTGQSNMFTVTGVHLAFRFQPAEAGVNAPLRYTVELEDARNRLVNSSSIGLGLSLETISGGDNATIAHPADTVDFGIANNSDRVSPASINSPGMYKLIFTVISQTSDAFDYTIAPITSAPFKIVANHLAFSRQPTASIVNVALRYTVVMRDYRNRTVTDSADQLTFTLIPTSGGAGAVLASGQDSLLAGVATNSSNMLSIDTPGTYKLMVVDVPPGPNDAVAQSITSTIPFRVRALRSVAI